MTFAASGLYYGNAKIGNNNIIRLQKLRLFGIGCLAMSAILVIWNLPDSNKINRAASGITSDTASDMDSDTASDMAGTPATAAAPVMPIDDVTAAPELVDRFYRLNVSKGDTLIHMLTNQGLERNEAHEAIQALAKKYDPRRLKPGQELELTISARPDSDNADGARRQNQIKALRIKINRTQDILASRLPEGGFSIEQIDHPLVTRVTASHGIIESSLYVAALQVGMPEKILGRLINIFSFDVDFQREIRAGDSFFAMYEQKTNQNGEILDSGNILIGEMTIQGKPVRFYRHRNSDGFVDYYDKEGRSVRKTLLRTPIDGARITSSFGNRIHPILGYTKKHTGVDFGARTGTPIYAAGNGTVEFVGRNGGYGNYIRIKHNGTYKTAYAHLSRFAKAIRKGQHVQQRQVIGYVGSTGRSTGPHLHYEIHKNNVKVNPLSVKLPTGKALSGSELAKFNITRARLDQQYTDLSDTVKTIETVEIAPAANEKSHNDLASAAPASPPQNRVTGL